ncbi:MAG: hypothetical protein LLG04_15560 [Parachlamydia sp.]|nr:hypothetical protein [Parachlamydia sp.]
MSAISNYLHFPHSWPQIVSRESTDRIKKIGQRAFVQLAISLSANVAFCAIFGSYMVPPSMTLLTVALGAVLTATLVTFTVKAIWRRCHPAGNKPFLPVWWDQWSGRLARMSLVNTLTLKLNRYIHEWGHAGAALLTYQKAHPEVRVSFRQGSTTYAVSHGLTRFGRFLGEKRALIFTTAAGLAAPVLLAMAEFAAAHHLHEKNPAASELLHAHGASQLLDTILYTGFLAFQTSKEVTIHDSMMLWKIGSIHPVVTFVSLIALPVAELCLFYYLRQRKRLSPTAA